jgi:hypothetical protein
MLAWRSLNPMHMVSHPHGFVASALRCSPVDDDAIPGAEMTYSSFRIA